MTLEKKRRRNLAIKILVITIITLIHMIPLIVMLLNAVRDNADITVRLIAVPESIDFENFTYTWVKGEYLRAYRNSLIIGVAAASCIVLFAGLAAYGLNKVKCFFPGFFRRYFYACLAIPAFSVIVPLYFTFNRLHLTDNLLGMILIYIGTNMSFNFIFIDAFFQGLPRELDDSARIDGASELQNFVHIVVPLAKPILTSMFLIAFVKTWNEFLFSNTFMSKDVMRTVSLKFFNFVGVYTVEYGYVFAAALISIFPIVIIYFLTQNSFIEGMTQGSIKG